MIISKIFQLSKISAPFLRTK